MSQEGIIDVIGGNPSIPIDFIANSGNAVPIANTLEILGSVVSAGTNPFRTVGSGDTIDIQVQISQAIASTDATKIGLSAFKSSDFTVDANGFVALNGAGVGLTITGQSGGALTPTAGNWNISGATTAAGTSPVVTSGAVSTLTVNVQTSQALASTDATKIGLSNFDSAAFDVDANGFVQLNGGGIAATSFDVQANTAPGTDPVVPTSTGAVTINGAAVANHSVVLETRSRAANAYNVEVQYAAAAAATDATKSGVAHFHSSQFSVDANGFVALTGGGIAIDSIHPDSGTDPVVPDGNGLVNIVGSGSTTTVGSLNTLTVQLTGLTQYNVLVGAGSATITKVAPSATSGVPLISQGSSADPAFGTAVVAGGGTGLTSATAYAPITGGTTTTGAFQSASTGMSTAGFVLTSTGASSLPTWQAGGGTGDVVGPGSSTDSAIAIFDGTTGKLLRNSVATIDVGGIYTSPAYISLTNVTGSTPISVNAINADTNAASTAHFQALVAGASAADAYYIAAISGGTSYSFGLDNSVAGDPFVISASINLGSTNLMTMQPAGSINKPLQPAFSALLSGNVTNATGDGTTYTIAFDTEGFDQQGNFASNTFTAPVTGKYQFNYNISLSGLSVGHTTAIVTVASVNTLRFNPYVTQDSGGIITLSGSIFVHMNATGTATMAITVGGSTKTVTVNGGSAGARFDGFLVC